MWYINLQVRKIDYENEKKNEKKKYQQSASVIGQRPNFTIADCSASADCEKCSFGHCLGILRGKITIMLKIKKFSKPF